jgi:hypothetical protein
MKAEVRIKNIVGIKNELNDNASAIVAAKVKNDMTVIENNMSQLSDSVISELSKTVALSSLLPLNPERMKGERITLDRKNYSFPSFISLGSIVNWHSTPSKIIGDEVYKSKLPFLLPIENNGIGFFSNVKFKNEITSALELSGLKIISGLPTGMAKVSIIDKNGSGQNFPTLLMLHNKYTDGKVLVEDNEIESELLAIKNSLTIITSSITSNGFTSIEDYNKNTEEIPQPYRLLFIANFPAGFSKKSCEALVAIMESGPSVGIYTFTTFTTDPKFGVNQTISGSIPLTEFLKNITMFEFQNKPHEYTRKGYIKHNVNIFSSPIINDAEYKKFYNSTFKIDFEIQNHSTIMAAIVVLNESIKDVNLRPVIDILKTIPKNLWTENAGRGVCAPFAKNGIENIFLSLGVNEHGEDEGTHHGIIGGSTGSGKTVTLHDMILHICMRYSPKEVNFWLLDYKEGTEFATYKNFPYIQILSMESEIEFGQEVLLRAIKLMEDRGALFKAFGVANLNSYNQKVTEENKLPRIIIIIDEFQALFPRKAQVTAITNERIDRILRLGRSFGVNLLLSTQTLKGIEMDPQLLSNMPLRIGLKMDEKDSVKLFGDNNSAPKFIQYPGEGIYNKSYGNSTSNVNFQAFFSPGDSVDKIKEMLVAKIATDLDEKAVTALYKSRFVYNGDMPGAIENNLLLDTLTPNKFYIGEPAGLNTEHSYFNFYRDFGDNLLIVGMDIEKASSISYYMTQQLLSVGNAHIYFGSFNSSFKTLFSEFEDNDRMTMFDNANADLIVDELYTIFKERKIMENDELAMQNEILMFNFFIDNSKLFTTVSHQKDSPMSRLKEIIYEGPEYGMHIGVYGTGFSALMNADMSRDIEKFKKKIILRGGNSLKVLGEDGIDTVFSASVHVAIGVSGIIGEKPFKFKPYIKSGLELKND